MKKCISALLCILTLAFCFTAEASSFDSADVNNSICVVNDFPDCPVADITACSAPIETSVFSPNVSTSVDVSMVAASSGKQNTSLASPDNPDIETETDNLCLTTSLTTSLTTVGKYGKRNKAKRKAKRRRSRSKNKSLFPGSKAPKTKCAWSN